MANTTEGKTKKVSLSGQTGSTEPKIALTEMRSLESLSLWDKNPRSIKTERFTELKNRLNRLGQTKPLRITEDGTVIGGNMRLRAMKELGWNEVWVSVSPAKTDKEIFDEALTDNEEFGYYEQEQVAELALELGLTELELQSYEISLGDPITLDSLIDKFAPEQEIEEDEVPEVDETETFSKLGEVYQLGEHRLMCGDATDFGAVSELMDGQEAQLIHTDPPYGVAMSRSLVSGKDNSIQNDDLTPEKLHQLISEAFSNCLAVAPNASMYWWIGFRAYSLMESILVANGVKPTNCIVWVKPSIGLGLTGYRYRHELCIFSGKTDDQSNSDVWEFGRDKAGLHPTMKPLELVHHALKNSSKRNDNVLDLFAGSGSTLMACEQSGRNCYAMELDPKYCDVIRKRYANHIGEGENWQGVTPVINSEELVNASR